MSNESMLIGPLPAATSMFSVPCNDPGVCIHVKGPCSIVIGIHDGMTRSHGKDNINHLS